MRINAIMTFDIDKDENEPFTEEELSNIYADFREMLEEVVSTKDLSLFTFANVETNIQIEDEVEK